MHGKIYIEIWYHCTQYILFPAKEEFEAHIGYLKMLDNISSPSLKIIQAILDMVNIDDFHFFTDRPILVIVNTQFVW